MAVTVTQHVNINPVIEPPAWLGGSGGKAELIQEELKSMFEDLSKKKKSKKGSSSTSLKVGLSPIRSPFFSLPKETVFLLDADTHAYRASAATDGGRWEIINLNGSVLEVHKYKRDADKAAKDYPYPVTIVQNFFPEPESHAIKILKDSLANLGVPVELYVTGNSNFRYDIVKNYKGNRSGRRPKHLSACKQYLMNQGAILDENLEADDLVIIRAKELDRLNIPWVIIGCDKDLKQIEGTFYDPFKNELVTISKGGARYNLWKQIASGDSTDNIRSPKGLGPATFDKKYKDFDWENQSDWEALILMVELYKSKEKQKEGESNGWYTARILRWIKTVASLVFLRRGKDEEYQLPNKEGKIERKR